MLRLVYPDKSHRDEWMGIVDEFRQAGERITPYSLWSGTDDFDEYLRRTNDISKGVNLNGMVQADTYFLMKDGESRILGAINLRYSLNDYLLSYGGNIGYGVRPSERGRGYASEMLRLALPLCRERGMERVLITCDKDNPASAKVMLKNGASLENEVSQDGTILQRYWIAL